MLCAENVTTVYFAGIGGTLGENTAYFTDHEATGYVTVTLADCAFVAEAVYGVQDGGMTTGGQGETSRGRRLKNLLLFYFCKTLVKYKTSFQYLIILKHDKCSR